MRAEVARLGAGHDEVLEHAGDLRDKHEGDEQRVHLVQAEGVGPAVGRQDGGERRVEVRLVPAVLDAAEDLDAARGLRRGRESGGERRQVGGSAEEWQAAVEGRRWEGSGP